MFYLVQDISVRARSIRIASADGGCFPHLLSSALTLSTTPVEAASFVSRADVHNGGWLDPVVILGVGLKKVF